MLIGGLALSFHVKPRAVQEVEFLFLRADTVPDRVLGFEPVRPGAFLHTGTAVEVKIVVPETAGQPTALFEKVVEAEVESDRMRVASALGLAALLLRRADLQDKADVVALIKTGRVAVSDFPLSSLKKVGLYRTLVAAAASEPIDG